MTIFEFSNFTFALRNYEAFGLLTVGVALLGYCRIKHLRCLKQKQQLSVELQSSLEKLRYLTATSPSVLFAMRVTSQEIATHWISDNISRIIGYTLAEASQPGWWQANLYAEDRERVLHESQALFVGKHQIYEYRFKHGNGSIIWVRDEQQLVADEFGHPKEILGSWTDITELKLKEINLRIAATAFETKDGIMITDNTTRIIRVNRAFSQLTGYSAEEVLGKTPAILNSGRQDEEFYKKMWHDLLHSQHWEGEIWNKRKDGNIYPEWLAISAVQDRLGHTSHYVATFFDMSERKAAEEYIRNLAYYDPLTGLPNRRLIIDRLGIALSNSYRSNYYGAIMFLDLDRFKILNDTQGHDKGDQLLTHVARRLQACVREGDTVARLGGDEFVVMLENLAKQQTEAAVKAQFVAEKIRDSLSAPYLLELNSNESEKSILEHHSSASIGLVLFQGHSIASDDLLKRADLAMYQAKHAGRDAIRVFDPAMQLALNERTALEADLRQAVLKQQFMLYYQSQVDSAGKIIGAEALIRWQHPQRGLIPPDSFIPLAEETGLIIPIGLWVLEQGCLVLAEWQKNPQTRHLKLAINVSPRQFHQADFVQQVEKVLVDTGVNPDFLKLEITENLIMDNLDEAINKMHAIKKFGVGFSMDDFGTGYSSLASLQKLPLDQLKVDRGFIRDWVEAGNDAAIIRTIVNLGRTLGLTVIAEGVETSIQLDYLAQYGCPIFQGYYFSEPLPLAQFQDLL